MSEQQAATVTKFWKNYKMKVCVSTVMVSLYLVHYNDVYMMSIWWNTKIPYIHWEIFAVRWQPLPTNTNYFVHITSTYIVIMTVYIVIMTVYICGDCFLNENVSHLFVNDSVLLVCSYMYSQPVPSTMIVAMECCYK